MKGLRLSVVALAALVLLPASSWGKPWDGASTRHRPLRTQGVDQSQTLDVNRINMVVTNIGSFAYDIGGNNAGLEFPKGTGKTCVFAAGIWMGGQVGGETRVAVMDYLSEYGPGAILPSGLPDNPDKPEYKVYKLERTYDTTAERDAALADYESGAESHGAPNVSAVGDVGLDILGDQMLWSVFNDADAANHINQAGGTAPLGIEVQQTIFAFKGTGALGQTAFMKYKLINKGGNTIENMYVSQWSDPRENDRHIAWCRDTYKVLGPYLGTTRYVNYLDTDETGDPAAVAYGPNYSRLRELKGKYDPENVFHVNVNIKPR